MVLSSRRIMVIDPQQAGISGDMFLGALLSLGANKKIVEENIVRLSDYIENCKSLKLTVENVSRQGFKGVKVTVKAEEKPTQRTGGEIKNIVKKFLDESTLSEKAKKFIWKTLLTLLEAEAKTHNSSVEDLHLHETGSVDTIADLIGVASALENLKVFNESIEVFSLPVCVGGGKVRTVHGILTIPPPATLEILTSRSFPFFGLDSEAELATPTGVALLVNLAKPINHYPLMHGTKVGYGAGEKDFEFTSNLLRIVIGERISQFMSDEIYIVETNVDDVDSETVGYLIEKLFDSGVKDAYVLPCMGKKNRVVLTVKALTDIENLEKTVNLLFNETGTLGVRVYPCKRFVLRREVSSVDVNFDNKNFKVRVKTAKDLTGKIVQVKPEFEDLRKIALETERPLREIRKKIIKLIS